VLLDLTQTLRSLTTGAPAVFTKIVGDTHVTAVMTLRDALVQILEADGGPEQTPGLPGRGEGPSRVEVWRLATVIAEAPDEFEIGKDRAATIREAMLDDAQREWDEAKQAAATSEKGQD
jgi:hypothetical protein